MVDIEAHGFDAAVLHAFTAAMLLTGTSWFAWCWNIMALSTTIAGFVRGRMWVMLSGIAGLSAFMVMYAGFKRIG